MNQQTTHLNIPLSKGKIILLALASILFVIASVVIWIKSYDYGSGKEVYYKAASIAGIVFFGMAAISMLLKIFDFKPGLITNHEGILDNSSGVSGQLIKWQDITSIKPKRIAGQWLVFIYVRNPEQYIVNMNWFKRFWLRANYKKYKTPISISANGLQCNFDELMAKLYHLHTQYSNTES